jgi:hypothetical protein
MSFLSGLETLLGLNQGKPGPFQPPAQQFLQQDHGPIGPASGHFTPGQNDQNPHPDVIINTGQRQAQAPYVPHALPPMSPLHTLLAQAPTQYMTRGNTVPFGPTQSAEGYYPQDAGGQGELGMNNMLQHSYDNPSATLYGGLQQPAGNPMLGQVQQPGGYNGADPYGWTQQNQGGVIARFPNQ